MEDRREPPWMVDDPSPVTSRDARAMNGKYLLVAAVQGLNSHSSRKSCNFYTAYTITQRRMTSGHRGNRCDLFLTYRR